MLSCKFCIRTHYNKLIIFQILGYVQLIINVENALSSALFSFQRQLEAKLGVCKHFQELWPRRTAERETCSGAQDHIK